VTNSDLHNLSEIDPVIMAA